MKSFKTSYSINSIDMFRHNFLITYRTFLRQKNSFLVNLIGLTTGLVCALLIYLWVFDELNIDKFHKNDSRLFRVLENRLTAEGIWTSRSASGLLGETLTAEMPEVEYAINASSIEAYTLSINEKNLKAKGQFAGEHFFKMFSYDLIQGDASSVLADKNTIVISSELAIKLFNTTDNIVGKSIEFEHESHFLVSGVFQKIPSHSSEQFDFVCSYEKYKENRDWLKYWANTATYAFVLLKDGADPAAFNSKIADYIKLKTENQVTHRTPFLKQYSKDYLYGQYENGVQSGGRIIYVKLFSTIAIFILLIACINFMNLSTAKAARRVKEVGIKKAIGAGRGSLIAQYFTESVLISVLSMLAAVLLVYLILPQFNEITGKHLTPQINFRFIMLLTGISMITGLLAGSYPALYLSGFKPVAVLKGKVNTLVAEVWIRKGLVVFQFALSVIFIVSVVVIYKQMEFLQSKQLGYSKENVIYFPLVGELKETVNQETFIEELKQVSGVVDASSISHDLTGHSRGTYKIDWEGKNPDDRTQFEVFTVNYGLLEMLNMELAGGRFFSKSYNQEDAKIILNQAAIDFMGMENPVGKTVKLNQKMEIIGVVKDFHFQSLHENIKPAFFIVNPYDTYLLMCKVSAGSEKDALAGIESLYHKLNPGFPFDFKFLDDEYNAQYRAEQRVSVLSKYFAVIAILISCLGLFALAAYTTERRTKEIGIRKVLGASEVGIVHLLTREFSKIVLAAILISLPISFVFTKQWLNAFAYKINLEWWYFIGAGVLTLIIAWITVAAQTLRAAWVNPADCLKNE